MITPSLFSQTLAEAFDHAGENREELQKVLDHYKKLGDEEKYKAAIFLIENMPIHQSLDYKWVDPGDEEIRYDMLDYQDFDQARKALARVRDTVQLATKTFTNDDIEVVSSEFLIENIEMAFKEWRQNSWSRAYTWEVFLEYILPYRSLVEPLENWRADYRFLVNDAIPKLENDRDPVELCTHLLYELVDFSFVRSRPDPIPILSPQQMLFRREGSCPDLANLALLASRSLGVAVTFDFTPHYAASSNRHYWNTVIDKNGNHIPFNSNAVTNKNDFLPYVYSATRKRLGKVFRKTYSIQPGALSTQIDTSLIPKGFLRDKNILDVTQEYVPTSEIRIRIKKENPPEVAFICVYNRGRWQPVDGVPRKDQQYLFQNLGTDIVYLASSYENRLPKYIGYPVLIERNKSKRLLKPDYQDKMSVTISRENEFKRDYIDFNTTEIEDGKVYRLQYWEKKYWTTLSSSVAQGRTLKFDNVPANALFRLLPRQPDGFERIFILEPGTHEIIWY